VVISAIAAPSSIIKRDGRTVPFTASKIEAALEKCFSAVGSPSTPLDELVSRVVNLVSVRSAGQTPTVEGVQDIVELVLQSSGEFEAAKHYILYRAARTAQRIRPIPDEVTLAFKASDDVKHGWKQQPESPGN
jgi:ribonucleoside-triphosphate reductase